MMHGKTRGVKGDTEGPRVFGRKSMSLCAGSQRLFEDSGEGVHRRGVASLAMLSSSDGTCLSARGHRGPAGLAAPLRERAPVRVACSSSCCNALAGPLAEGEVQLMQQALLIRLLSLSLSRRKLVCKSQQKPLAGKHLESRKLT